MMQMIQPAAKGGYKVMKLWVEGCTVRQEWGILGGKMQIASSTVAAVNVGKANEKSAEQAALDRYNRKILELTRDGYKEVAELPDAATIDRTDHTDQLATMDFDNPPESFALSKPEKSISDKKLDELLKSEGLGVDVKYNGFAYRAIRGSGDAKLLTFNMHDHSRKYPDLVKELSAVMPHNTVWAGELYDDNPDIPHMEAFANIKSVARADVTGDKVTGDLKKTAERLAKFNVRFAVYAVPYHEGELELDVNWNYLRVGVPQRHWVHQAAHVNWEAKYRQYMSEGLTRVEAFKRVIRELPNIEGVVLYDRRKDSKLSVTFNGEPKRTGCWKLKPKHEDDLLAVGYTDGVRAGKVAALVLKEWDGKEWVDRGTCSSGLTKADLEPDAWTFPQVVQVEYACRMPGTRALQHPVFVKRHEYKTQQSIEAAQ